MSTSGAFDILGERMAPVQIPATYCSGVLVGQWRAARDWDATMRTRDLRRGGCRKDAAAALDEFVPLALPADYVPTGANVMLLATDTHGWPARTCGDNALALALEELEDDSPMSCSPNVSPCERTTFVVDAEGGGHIGVGPKLLNLAYGQRFVLRPAVAQHLAIRCELPTLNTMLGLSKHPLLKLCARTDRYCYWTAWPSHPSLRVEAKGSAVPAHWKTVLRHEASGQCLAAETGFWSRSGKGLVECEVSAYSSLDTYGKETAPNFWAFVVQKPAEVYTPVPPGRCPS